MEARALAVILAAGEGKRMKSILPKVLHKLAGQPLVEHVVQASFRAEMDRTIVVVGHRRDMVIQGLESYPVEFVIQDPQWGTGHAMQQVVRHLGRSDGTCVVMLGDAPFVKPETLAQLVDQHRREGNAVTVLTAELENPEEYGRIVRGSNGQVEKIVEYADASEKERSIREINSGIYAFDFRLLAQALEELDRSNQQDELYLTDTLAILRKQKERVGAMTAADTNEVLGINDFHQLHKAERLMRARIAALAPPEAPVTGEPGALSPDDEDDDEIAVAAGETSGLTEDGVYRAMPDTGDLSDSDPEGGGGPALLARGRGGGVPYPSSSE